MTEEQIAELPITVSAAMVDPSESAVKLALSAVRRLLEERKRLLEAVKFTLVQQRSMPLNRDEFEEMLLKDIAYAEEAAP